VFEDHKKSGKKFIPTISEKFQRIDFVECILPEIIWIGFVLEFHGEQIGIELASSLIEIANHEASADPKPDFSLISAHRFLSIEEKDRIRDRLHQDGKLLNLKAGLGSFIRCYPAANPLAYLWGKEPIESFSDQDIAFARAVVSPRLNRWSQKGTEMQAVVLYGEAITGRLHYPSDMPPPNLDAIFDDFDSPDGQRASSHARTTTTMLFSFHRERMGTTWSEYFWKHGLKIDPIKSHIEIEKWATEGNPLQRFYQDFSTMASMLVKEISEKLILQPLSEEEHTVINGLLARQATLAIGVAQNIDVWNWDIGPLYLRAMTDCHITLAWILGDSRERSRLYILYGLGREKLWMEHYKEILSEIEDPEEKESYHQMLAASKAWVDSQSFLFFVTVDYGNWSGKTTRQMAEEAGCLDLYNFAYQPYSFSAHSTWNHIGKFNAIPCFNPLHKNMRLPKIPAYGGEPSIVSNAAKYLEKSARSVRDRYSLELEAPPPHSWTSERLSEIFQWFEKKSSAENMTPATGAPIIESDMDA
jgi:hypothetical protein